MTGEPTRPVPMDCGHLFKLYHWSARRFALVFVDPHEADDIVSESFARLFSAVQRGKGPIDGRFWPYLRTIIRNECTDRARRRILEDRTVNEYVSTVVRNAAAYGADAVASYAAETALVNAFDRLSSRHRLVLILTVAEGRSCAEAGAALHLSGNAVAALAYRARKHLRALIDEERGSLDKSPEWAAEEETFAHRIAANTLAA